MDENTMPWAVGIRFSHAALQVLADDNAIDLLHIKGPAVDDSLLEVRTPDDEPSGEAVETVARRSIDADVLVRPTHVDRLFTVMRRHGWTMKYRFEDGSAFEHAATMVHPFLAPVDVHRRFPGLDADPDAAFERLWADRHTVPIAGLPCEVPSVSAQRLVLILHATRAGRLDHADIRRSWTAATAAQRDDVQRLAAEVGAEVALAAGTGRLDEFRGAKGYELWQALSTRERSLARIWVARVKAAPTRRAAIRTAVHLMLPNPHRMEVTFGRAPTTAEVAKAYLARARRGVRELVTVVRARAAQPRRRG